MLADLPATGVTFYPVGIADSIVGGSAYEPTPWRAVQRAAKRWMLGVRCG